jgi:hypothetical protein
MCSPTRWLAKRTFITIALCLFLPIRTTLAEDALWHKAVREAKQLREQGRYAEAEKAHRLALAEAEKFGAEDRRLALSLKRSASRNPVGFRLSGNLQFGHLSALLTTQVGRVRRLWSAAARGRFGWARRVAPEESGDTSPQSKISKLQIPAFAGMTK